MHEDTITLEEAKKRGVVFDNTIFINLIYTVVHFELPGPDKPWTKRGLEKALFEDGRLYVDNLSISPIPGVVVGPECRECGRRWTVNELVEKVKYDSDVKENRTGIAYCAACGTFDYLRSLDTTASAYGIKRANLDRGERYW